MQTNEQVEGGSQATVAAAAAHRKTIGVGAGNSKILTIQSVISHNNLRQSDIDKLGKVKSQIDMAKEKAIRNAYEKRKKKASGKHILNVDTDSDGDPASGDEITPQNGVLDKNIRLGTEQAKAKLNAGLLFNSSASLRPIRRGQEKTGQNSSDNSNNNGGVLTVGSLKNQQNEARVNGGVTCQLSEDSIEEVEQINFLKGLTQNQLLPGNCEMSECIENDKILIDIKTTDFFTFVRLEDEIDELRRKHVEFQGQKGPITANYTDPVVHVSLNRPGLTRKTLIPVTNSSSNTAIGKQLQVQRDDSFAAPARRASSRSSLLVATPNRHTGLLSPQKKRGSSFMREQGEANDYSMKLILGRMSQNVMYYVKKFVRKLREATKKRGWRKLVAKNQEISQENKSKRPIKIAQQKSDSSDNSF